MPSLWNEPFRKSTPKPEPCREERPIVCPKGHETLWKEIGTAPGGGHRYFCMGCGKYWSQ